MRSTRWIVALIAAVSFGHPVDAQQAATAPALDFSGTTFGNFQIRTDSTSKAAFGGKAANKFELDRVYLTFRMPAGDKTSIRITTDIFQNAATGYYGGWTVRLKYGYLQRELSKNLFGVNGLTAVGRVGMLHTVVIDQMEQFWPRWLGTVGTERNGFFSSADMGAAGVITLPKKRGEVYVTVTNGPGYTSAETDRFKDFAARVTLTPFANQTGIIKGLAITPWYYKGASASLFFNSATTPKISEGVQKDRRGIVVGLKDRRLTAMLEQSQRVEGIESGANTALLPRVVTTRTSNLTSAFAMVRPLEWINSGKQSPFGVLGRIEGFKVDDSLKPGTQYSFVGAFWDASAKSTFTLGYQTLARFGGSTASEVRMLALHWKADF